MVAAKPKSKSKSKVKSGGGPKSRAARRESPPDLPAATVNERLPYTPDAVGTWLFLGDVHMGSHDRTVVELAVNDAVKQGAVGVLLNGDILDCHELSDHDQDESAVRYKNELDLGRQFFKWLRAKLPKAEIVYREGKHEDRLRRYIAGGAPALQGLKGVSTEEFLGLADFGIDWVGDKRAVEFGKLSTFHGHEFKGGGGVNPARWLFQRTLWSSACGHFHRTDEHHERDVRGRVHATWSIGCACDLKPLYFPNNKWNHGYAIVTTYSDGWFEFRNRRVIKGRVV